MSSKTIAIIGWGVCGIVLATELQAQGQQVTVFDNSPKDIFFGEHVPYEFSTLFSELHIPTEILEHNSIASIRTSGYWGQREIWQEWLFRPGYDYIILRPWFDRDIRDFFEKQGGIFREHTRISDIFDQCVYSQSDNLGSFESIINTSWRLSKFSNQKRLLFDDLIAVSWVQKNEMKLMSSEICIESSPNGWWYYVVTPTYSNLTFFTDSDIYAWLDLRSEHSITRLASSINIPDIPGKIMPCYSSILQWIPENIHQVWDAFMSFDPLSAKWIYKACRDALAFAKAYKENTLTELYAYLQKDFQIYLSEYHSIYTDAWQVYKTPFYTRRLQPDERLAQEVS